MNAVPVQDNKLNRIIAWIRTFPGYDILSRFNIDYTDQVPGTASLMPGGLVEVSRSTDILGNVTLTNQLNFALYIVLGHDPQFDQSLAAGNESWLAQFQEWVQEQSACGAAPSFGDDPDTERITAQNGMIYAAAEGTATFAVQFSVRYSKTIDSK